MHVELTEGSPCRSSTGVRRGRCDHTSRMINNHNTSLIIQATYEGVVFLTELGTGYELCSSSAASGIISYDPSGDGGKGT